MIGTDLKKTSYVLLDNIYHRNVLVVDLILVVCLGGHF
jgi:hypothetical protein